MLAIYNLTEYIDHKEKSIIIICFIQIIEFELLNFRIQKKKLIN